MSRSLVPRTVAGLVAVLGCILAATNVSAMIIVTPSVQHPYNPEALQLTKEVVRVDLSDRAAQVNVECTYHNSSQWVLEGTYLFPLPPEAAVDKFSLFVDGEEIRAELLDATAARNEYESIVRRMKDPALLEYVDRQLLKARIYPIQPNSDAKIRLYYTHPLVADFGTTDFAFPLSGERTAPGAAISLIGSIETQSVLKAVTSPTHEVKVTYDGSHRATLTAAPRADGPKSDLHILCTYDTREVGAQFLTTTDNAGQNYFMAIIAPGEAGSDAIVPKDVVFCFDHSGSMAGEKLTQARAALKFCLSKLNPDDRFGLVVFNDRIDSYAGSLRQATVPNVDSAHRFLYYVDAEGGTFIEGALVRSMDMFDGAKRPKYLVFLTDGLPTVGTRDPGLIKKSVVAHNANNARVFTFGVGFDLNAALLNDLAAEGKGQSSYVAPKEDVEIAVSNFFSKISRPVLSDCKLQFTGVDVHDVYPFDLPDVFAGSEIVVVGRFDEDANVTARLTGTRGAAAVSHVFNAEFTARSGRYEFIPKLWAGRRIGNLLEDMRRNGETREVKDEVIRLSKKYGIMTSYTSFLAAPEEVRIAQNSGVAQGGVGISVAHDRFAVRSEAPASVDATAKRDISSEQLRSSGSTQALMPAAPSEPEDQKAAASISAAGRQFTLIDGIWTDWALFTSKSLSDTIKIKPYSDAYFRLNQVPGMAQLLAVGERVVFLWKANCVVKIDISGEEKWNSTWERLL
ncbi:MAG: VWA domain-containing protein [candidate division Zixibacteria bacterium]|nr:VWA domain-containing protein [candidate division Zixibacteria bacterium]